VAYWIAWIVKPFIKDPGRRTVRRRRAEEPPNPDLNFTDDPVYPSAQPAPPVPFATSAGENPALDFGPLPGSLELSRKERYRSARTMLTWFWLAMGILFISPFLIVLLGFVGGFLGAFFVADVPKAMADYAAADRAMLSRYEAVRQQHANREISDARMADVLEQDVLPEWRAAADRFTSINRIPDGDRPLVGLYHEYIRLEREALEGFIHALRADDDQAMNRAIEKWDASERVAKSIDASWR